MAACVLTLVAGTAGLGAIQGETRTARQRIPAFSSLLTSYAAGHVGAVRTFAFDFDKPAAVRDFPARAREWINAGRSSAARRLIAATFALDVAQHWAGGSDWPYAQRLIAWGCTEMRSAQIPEPAERLWHLAAVAVAEAGEDWTLLVGRRRRAGEPVPASRNSLENELRQGHVSHALSRFPDEPRLALAAAVAAENLSWEIGGFGRDNNVRGGLMAGEIDRNYLDRLQSGDLAAPDGSKRPVPGAKQLGKWHLARVDDVMAVRERYLALTEQPQVAAEAHVRLALILFRLVERDKALQHLELALELAREPEVVYLAHLLRGAIQEREGRDDEAIEAYRAALNVFPRAQSATSRLVARLFGAGRRAEAAALADEFFATAEAAPDPWAIYRVGEARFLRSYLARLRGSGE
jgi:hypothetical protein